MNSDFSELVEYLDKKFGKVDEKFGVVDEKLGVIDNKFGIVDERLARLENDVEVIKSTMVTKEDFNNLQTAVDAYAKKADTYFQEMVMLAHKVDKLEKWIHQIAERVGIKLED